MPTLSQLILSEVYKSSEEVSIKEIRVKSQVKKALMDLEEEYIRLAIIHNEDEENEKVTESKIDIVDNIPVILDDSNQHITIIDNFKSEDFYKVFSKEVIPNRIEMYTNYLVTVS